MCNQSANASAMPYARRFGHHHRAAFVRHFRSMPVNIEEKDDRFELFLYAPELNKERFTITVKDDLLTISYKAQEGSAQEESTGNFTRREYHTNAFERSFILNGKVEAENIAATYAEGVLKVILPKKPEANKPAQSVTVQ